MPICCVDGCNNRYNPASTVRFYRVPGGNRQFQVRRRRLWLEAIQKANGSSCKLCADVRICGAHFISGEASTDPDKPNFVPTLFPSSKKPQGPNKTIEWTCSPRTRLQQKVQEEAQKRTTRGKNAKTENVTALRKDAETKVTTNVKKDAETKVTTSVKKEAEAKVTTAVKKDAKTKVRKDEETEDSNTVKKDAETKVTTTVKKDAKTKVRKDEETDINTIKKDAETKVTTTVKKDAETKVTTTVKKDAKTKVRKDEETEDSTTVKKDDETEVRTTVTKDEETEDITVKKDSKTKKLQTLPSLGCNLDQQFSALMEPQDEPEMQTMLCLSEPKKEEIEDKNISDKDQVETKSKIEPETMKPKNKSGPEPSSVPQKPAVDALKLKTLVVLVKALVLPEGAYKVDLRQQNPTTLSTQQDGEETAESPAGLMESNVVVRDQQSFPCNMCDRTFTTSHYLKRHKLLHVRDVRKCLRCGTLFCRRHNHVLFQTQPKVLLKPPSGSEESSSSSEEEEEEVEEREEEGGPPGDQVNTEKTKTSEAAETPDNATATPPDSAAPPNSLVLMTPDLTDARKALLVSEKPPPMPSPPSPILHNFTNYETFFQVRPLLSDTSPASIKPNLPQQPQLPSALKIFSPQHLTSALLDVQRNYEYILSKPKKKVVIVKKEPVEPVVIRPVEKLVEPPIKRVKLEKIAYDLEIVI